MKPDLEQRKKLFLSASHRNVRWSFDDMQPVFNEYHYAVPQLISRIEELEKALEHTKKFCLCERNTFGFDYGEVHPLSGKPGAGKRWLTPQVVATKALEGFKE